MIVKVDLMNCLLLQISTLRFASRMMCVSSEPTVNEHYDPAVSTKAALYIISLKYRKLSLITQ